MQLWKEHLGLLNFENWSQLLEGNTKSAPTINQAACYPRLTRSFNNALDIKKIEEEGPVKMLDRASRTFSFYDTFKSHHHPQRHDAAALDPLSDHTYNHIWLKQATDNTHLYRRLFRCVPDDTVHTYAQHRKFVSSVSQPNHLADDILTEDQQHISDQLNQIRGHLVLFPKDYLKDENLLAGGIIDTVTPLIIFT